MDDENVLAPAPTRSDDQILPFAAWVPIKKSNHVLNLQKNPIFQIVVDILQNTNFFRAFTASASLDEDWFTLDANLLREALEITPIDQAHPFVSPPSGDVIMDFVNELGYPEGIITSTNVDYAELMWEDFVHAMQTFLTDKANLGSPTKKGRKDKPHVISYCRFTKLIICHLGRIYNIYQRSASPFHLAEEDLRLGNLKFVSKGEIDEVFGMPILNELISNNIRNASYYNAYMEMVAKHDQKVAAKKEGKKKFVSTKQPKPKPVIKKSSKPAPAPKPKVTKLVDEPDEELAHSEPEPEPKQEGTGEEYDMEHAIQMSLELFQAQGHVHVGGVAIQEPTSTTEEALTRPSAQPLDDTFTNIIRGSPSPADAETSKQENVKEKTVELDQDQVGSDPGETLESRPQPEQVHMEEDQARPDPRISRAALAGPDPEPTHDEFMVDLYPKVQESLKFPTDEHVILEDPLSSTRTLSSMKNLEDAYAIGDQFINDKSTNDEPGKLNVEAEVVSMVTVPIYQESSSAPPLTTKSELAERVTALEKKLSDLEQTNKNLDNTTRNLGSSVYNLELRDLPHKINEIVRDNVKEAVQIALQAPLRDHFRDLSEEDMKEMLHQRMFETSSYKSLPEHIALYEALEASMKRAQRDEFLAEKDKSHKRRRDDQDPPPSPLDLDQTGGEYEDKDEDSEDLLIKIKIQKILKDILKCFKYIVCSYLLLRHDAGTSGSSQPQTPQSSTLKKSDTREAPSSSFKQQSGPHAEQPVEDIPIEDSDNISDSEDTDSAHLPKTKQKPEWLKPIPDDERPATPEPACVILTSHFPNAINNWANALATTYQDPAKNSLLEKTRDMRTFMN
ncbi:hypothetical protein Tco_1105314 [Tanacetum coccineum]